MSIYRVVTTILSNDDIDKFDTVLKQYPDTSVASVVRSLIQNEYQKITNQGN